MNDIRRRAVTRLSSTCGADKGGSLPQQPALLTDLALIDDEYRALAQGIATCGVPSKMKEEEVEGVRREEEAPGAAMPGCGAQGRPEPPPERPERRDRAATAPPLERKAAADAEAKVGGA